MSDQVLTPIEYYNALKEIWDIGGRGDHACLLKKVPQEDGTYIHGEQVGKSNSQGLDVDKFIQGHDDAESAGSEEVAVATNDAVVSEEVPAQNVGTNVSVTDEVVNPNTDVATPGSEEANADAPVAPVDEDIV